MKVHESITPELQTWMREQHVFFVASAPLTSTGHVNVSPKGYDDCFRIVDQHTVLYADLTGSGNETSAHVRENGRLTLMFCAFTGPPRILRLYGRGEVVLSDDDASDFDRWAQRTHLTVHPGTRQIVILRVDRITTSCGYAVPRMEYVADRSTHKDYVRGKVKTDPHMKDYQRQYNQHSVDGLVTHLGQRLRYSNSGGKLPMVSQTTTKLVIVLAILVVFVAVATEYDEIWYRLKLPTVLCKND